MAPSMLDCTPVNTVLDLGNDDKSVICYIPSFQGGKNTPKNGEFWFFLIKIWMEGKEKSEDNFSIIKVLPYKSYSYYNTGILQYIQENNFTHQLNEYKINSTLY